VKKVSDSSKHDLFNSDYSNFMVCSSLKFGSQAR
jgi:hypothetical protein